MDNKEENMTIEIEDIDEDFDELTETTPSIEDIHADFEELMETGLDSEEPVFNLEEIRKSKGLTVNDMSFLTKINPRIIKAIEQQRFDLLPDPFYAKSFIKMYMKVLNTDGDKILALYDRYLTRVASRHEKKYPAEVHDTLQRRHSKIWLLAIIAAVLLAAVIGYVLMPS